MIDGNIDTEIRVADYSNRVENLFNEVNLTNLSNFNFQNKNHNIVEIQRTDFRILNKKVFKNFYNLKAAV